MSPEKTSFWSNGLDLCTTKKQALLLLALPSYQYSRLQKIHKFDWETRDITKNLMMLPMIFSTTP
jgi:hypothetical protein